MMKRYCAAILAIVITLMGILTGCGDKSAERFIYQPGDPFVTNVAGTKYLLKADMLLEISNPDNQKILATESARAQVRSIIIEILRSTSYEEIMAADAQAKIASEIKTNIEEKLQISYVENIFFKEFVVQH